MKSTQLKMANMVRAPLSLIGLIALTGSSDPILVPDISQRKVEIRYSFSGAELLLFGAIAYPDGRIPTESADIAVVLKGPAQSILIREKSRFAGIWMNADKARFRSVPGFYSIASSRPLKALINERTAAIYELGVGNIQLSPVANATPSQQRRFERGLVDLMGRKSLYSEHPNSVEIDRGILYQARISIPASVPVGRYIAETFLIRNGKVFAAATRRVDIKKIGFERVVADFAESFPFIYGVFAIFLSVAMGWMAGSFSRRFG